LASCAGGYKQHTLAAFDWAKPHTALFEQSLRTLNALLQAVLEILILATAFNVSSDSRTDNLSHSTILNCRNRFQSLGLFC